MKNDRGGRRVFSILFLAIACVLLSQSCGTKGDETLYQRAQGFWERKMYALAAQNYEQFSVVQPTHPKAAASLYKAANLYASELSAYPKAIELLLRLTAVYPDTPFRIKAHEELAEIYATHLKSYTQAVFQYQEILDLKCGGADEDLSGIQYRIGRCYFLMGDWQRAASAYERVVKEFPKGEKADSAAYQIAYLHFLSGRYEDAERSFRAFLHDYPRSAWAFDGMLYLAQSKERQSLSRGSQHLDSEREQQLPQGLRYNGGGRKQTGVK